MTAIHAISRTRHAHQRWMRYSNYSFACADNVCALVLSELTRALQAMPLAFTAVEQAFVPVAIMGLRTEMVAG